MPYGEMLKITGAASPTEASKNGHQQQQPLGVCAPLGAAASPVVPAGRQSDRDWQKAGEWDESSPDETGTRMAAPAVSCRTFQSALEEGFVIRCGPCTILEKPAAPAKVPGIASEGVGAGNGFDAVFDTLSQITAETESSSCSEYWQGARDRQRSLRYKSYRLKWL